MIRTNITLDAITVSRINEIANFTGASKSEIIRRGVLAYLRALTATDPERGIALEALTRLGAGLIEDGAHPDIAKKKRTRPQSRTKRPR
jgi:hypothetical protein